MTEFRQNILNILMMIQKSPEFVDDDILELTELMDDSDILNHLGRVISDRMITF